MIRVGVAGASGYSGAELLRYLCRHPHVELGVLAAGTQQGRRLAESFPQFRGILERPLEEADWRRLAAESDVVFLALPHGLSMDAAPELLEGGARVVDLGADFRLRDPQLYRDTYGEEHRAPALLDEAVYGLVEARREQIRETRLVASPGCYPTAAVLPLLPVLPLVEGDEVRVVVDAKSGVSGAGRGASLGTHFSEVNENLRPYKIGAHRHAPEMEQALHSVRPGTRVFFSPHLVPMTRGLLATCYLVGDRLPGRREVESALRAAYAEEPFVRLLDGDDLPETKATYGSNFCDVAVRVDEARGCVVLLAAIDNLGKGAAGQAVQSMNVLCDLEETTGLLGAPLYP
jgi:N-acetyl-gamma-glutamyl-phosphate reductase